MELKENKKNLTSLRNVIIDYIFQFSNIHDKAKFLKCKNKKISKSIFSSFFKNNFYCYDIFEKLLCDENENLFFC